MVNGKSARILYFGAFGLLVVQMIGATVLLALRVDIPTAYWALSGTPGFLIVGAHIQPTTESGKGGSP